MTDLSVSPAELHAAADQVISLALTAVDQVITTTLSVATTAQSWGDDELGTSFAELYLRPAGEAMAAVHQMAFQLAEVGERLHTSAVGYEGTEQTNVAEANAVPDGSTR